MKKKLIFKENFICKENFENVTKVKSVKKIKKHNDIYFGALVLASYCYCGYKV